MATRKRPSTAAGAKKASAKAGAKSGVKRAATKRPAKKAAALAAQATTRPPTEPALPHDENALWIDAVRAAESKKADSIKVLDLRNATTFTDYFVICSGTNAKQVQAIAEEIDRQLGQRGARAKSLEGFKNAEWILADYGDMIVHVFSQQAREYYQLERLWNQAVDVPIPAA